ncbi:MAG: twin-arginine translocase TatA/TatE family subunit [Victivallales bacterium]|nr:twin-arginine translocase TatA/TatE family subunit [Lentisphaeria bacterium]HCG50627.1 twin-arginine translocase TatA/TatE family subunit [Lentisphaeria bacterium]
MSLGLTEILVIFVAILLLFGAKRIPEIARALGRASHEFKKAKDEIINETEELKDAAEKKAALEDQAGKKDNDKKNDSE